MKKVLFWIIFLLFVFWTQITEWRYINWEEETIIWTFEKNTTLDSSWNIVYGAPLVLNLVYFDLSPSNDYYLWKNVEVKVKWLEWYKFKLLSIRETWNVITEEVKVKKNLDIQKSQDKKDSLKDKLLKRKKLLEEQKEQSKLELFLN